MDGFEDAPPSPWAPTRPPGLDRLLGHVADRLTAPADPHAPDQVSIVITRDGQPKVFSASATALTNIDVTEALRSLLGAAYRAALRALEHDDPWLPAIPAADPINADGYRMLLDVVRAAPPAGISRDQILTRLYERADADRFSPERAFGPEPADVTRWLRQALSHRDVVAADLSDTDDDGLPVFVRLADDMTPAGTSTP